MAQKKGSSGSGAAMGAGLVALAAAAAGAYFLYGKDASKRRRTVRGWALRAKGEVLEGIEQLKKVDEKQYHALVNKVTARYKSVKQASPAEVAQLARELKGHWRSIHKHLAAAGGDVKRSAKKVGKKAVGSAKRKPTRGGAKKRSARRR